MALAGGIAIAWTTPAAAGPTEPTVAEVTEAEAADNPENLDSEEQQAAEHRALADKRFAEEDFPAAAELYLAAHTLISDPELLFKAALAQEGAKTLDKATATYARYLKDAPGGAHAAEATQRRDALVRQRQKEELKTASQRRQDEVDARLLSAMALRDGGAYDRALKQFRALQADTSDPELSYEIAEAHRLKGNWSSAEEEYERYLDSEIPVRRRAEAHQRMAEVQEAMLEEERRNRPSEGPSVWPGAVLLGGGAILGGVALYFQLDANSTESALREDVAGTPPLDRQDPRIEDGRASAERARLFAISSAAVGALGTALLVRALLHDDEPATSQRANISTDGRNVWATVRW